MEKHMNGTGAKYTKGRSPFTLAYTEAHSSKSSALKREAEIKSLSRDMKLKLIEANPSIVQREAI